jgi:hypothetical protein
VQSTSTGILMLGYIDQQKAKEKGFTHQGKYFGISLWITDSHRPTIAAKWPPMEYIISFFSRSEKWIKEHFFPNMKHRHHVNGVKIIGS